MKCESCGKREGRYQTTFLEGMTVCDQCREEEVEAIKESNQYSKELGL